MFTGSLINNILRWKNNMTCYAKHWEKSFLIYIWQARLFAAVAATQGWQESPQ